MALGLPSIILFCICCVSCYAADPSISTSITTPPLQWINLTNLLSGTTSPPALKDAVIGYDETSRSLIIFGGESEGGLPQSSTYLLNLDTLTWSLPNPPTSLDSKPAARSAAIGGCDFAASNRQGFVVIGGKGSDGKALSDVWEFDFNNEFWAEVDISPGSPSPRWGAVGGIDARSSPIQDTVVAGPNNTFYLAGGSDGTEAFSMSDIWRLNISGTLSSNLPHAAMGSWDHISIGKLPDRTGSGGTLLYDSVIAVGGCSSDASCVEKQDSYILDTSTRSSNSPTGCPVPRLDPVLVANPNAYSTSFASQTFLLLGTFNDTLWSDGGNLVKGEVAILDTNTGIWSRVLPSGDPGNTGTEAFPSPRQGASAFAYTSKVVGSSRSDASDIIVFGGQDASGQYLSDLWILRAYNGEVTSSDTKWSGFGSGDLETGIDASGVHVSVEILSQCATAIVAAATSTEPLSSSTSSPAPSSVSSPSSSPTTTSISSSAAVTGPLYDTSVSHKVLAPVSLALFLPALVLYRLFSSAYGETSNVEGTIRWIYLSGFLTILSYGIGVAALALSFTTMKANTNTVGGSTLTKRATSSTLLKTTHAQAGLAFFILLYAVVPIILLMLRCSRRTVRSPSASSGSPKHSAEMAEKLGSPDVGSSREPIADYSEPPSPSPRMRTPSFGTSGGLLNRRSTDSESMISAAAGSASSPPRAFEVVNRPRQVHKHSGSSNFLSPVPIEPHQAQRTLADIDWLQRRRDLNAVDELDFAITQHIRAQQQPQHEYDASPPLALFPGSVEALARVLLHFVLLGLCVVCLVALWARAPRAAFGVFLAWIVAMYSIIVYLSWIGKPPASILTIVFLRLRSAKATTSTPNLNTNTDPRGHPGPTHSDGPYLHQPPSHRPTPQRQDSNVHMSMNRGARSGENGEDDDDDEDEDTRQRRMELEMERRDVSIVTVPKRRLWITNPES